MLCCWNIGNKSRIIPLCGYFTSPFNLLSVVIAACVSGPHVDYPFWKQCYKSVLYEKKIELFIFILCICVCLHVCMCITCVPSVCEGLKKVMDHLEPGVADSSEPPCGSWNPTGTEPGSRARATTVPLLQLQALLSWTPALAPREIFYKSVSGWLRDVVSLIIRRLIGPEHHKACLDASFWFTHP